MTDASAAITDSYTYDAFGNLISRIGPTDSNYLYAGEQFDPDLGFYYNRARYSNTATGRFASMDGFEGDEQDPQSLHKYTYAKSNPIDVYDPTGFYTQSDGYAAEDAIFEIYKRDHPNDVSLGGKWAKLGDVGYRLKPDILNSTSKSFLEIKPFTISGIYGGGTQMAIYTPAFLPFGYLPDVGWMPSQRSIQINGRDAIFVNAGGLVLYTDELRLSGEFLTITTVVVARELLRLGAAGEIGQIGQLARFAYVGTGVSLEAEVGLAIAEGPF